jgi:hypothetical protein
MKTKAAYIIFVIFISTQFLPVDTMASKDKEFVPPGPEDVLISPNGIIAPVDTFVLVRTGKGFGAMKFTKLWTGKTEKDRYALYESYYVNDMRGDFQSKEVETIKEKLSFPKPFGIGRFSFSFGNRDIQIGPIKLWWGGGGSIYFHEKDTGQNDVEIELSPTKWTSLKQLNVFDERLKWYRYDGGRPRTTIPVEQLW